MPQLVPDTARADIHLQYAAGVLTAMTSFYVRAVEPNVWTQTMLDQIRNIAYSFWEDRLRLVSTGEWKATKVEVRDIGAAGGLTSESNGPFTAGALGESPLSSLIAMKLELRTTPGGLPRRGAMFLPVGSEASLAGNVWLDTFISSVATQVGWLDEQLSSDPDFEWVVVSRFLDNVERPEGVTRGVASWNLRKFVATQRGRLRN